MFNSRIVFFSSLLSLIVLTVAVFCWNLFAFSALQLELQDVWNLIFTHRNDDLNQQIIKQVRLPRAIVASVTGASLACAGAIMQALTRNPLASPSLFGINSGAALGVALVSTFAVGYGLVSISLAAIIGGGGAWLLVMVLGGGFSSQSRTDRLVLAGIATSALCAALTKASVILVEDQAASVLVWLAGSFADVDVNAAYTITIVLLPCLAISLLLGARINLLQLGDERALTLGVELGRFRWLLSILVLLLVGVSVSAVGSIAFVGLMVPHISRVWFGYDHRKLLPVCMLIGALLCLSADAISRAIVFPAETPAGAVLALIGAPWFLYLARSKV